MRKFFKKALNFMLGLVLCTGLLPASSLNAATAMTFDHFDIQSAASFSYKDADGVTRTVNINFYNDTSALGNVRLYKKNLDGTREEIPISGSWQNASGYGSNAKKEYRIRGSFQRFYNDNINDGEVVYIFEYYLSVDIGGQTETLVYTNEYSYSSENNVCPGTVDGNKGIDVELSGNDLNDYFSPALKIVKIVEGSTEGKIFTFNLINDDGQKIIPVATAVNGGVNSGDTIAGGFTAGRSYTISENLVDGYKIKSVKIGGAEIEANSDGSYTFMADRNGGTTVIEFTNAELTSLEVEKVWNKNVPEAQKKPVTVELYKDDKATGETLDLTADGGWKKTFNNLDKYNEDGNLAVYTVKEVEIDGSKLASDGTLTIYDENIVTEDGDKAVVGRYNSTVDGTTVVNGWTPATNIDDNPDTVALKLKKVGAEDENVLLAGAEFTLTKDGEKIGDYTSDENGVINLNNLAEGVYTLTETKAPVDYLVLKEAITINVVRDHKLVSVDDGALINTYHNEFTVTVDDPNDSSYNSGNGEITIKDELQTVEVEAEKNWLNTETALPSYVEVQLYGDGEKVGDAAKLSTGNSWSYKWEGLRKSVDGEDIEYTVKETKVFGASENGFLVYGTEQTEEETEVIGRWDAKEENTEEKWTVTNSWVSANYRFDGSTDFYIEKIDKDGNPLANVEFKINDDFITTDADGMIKVSIPEEVSVRDGVKNYTISESKTLDGYDLDAAEANLKVEVESAFTGFDSSSFTNIFSKKFTFTVSGNENYVWNAKTHTFVLKNKRSTAKSLTIEKSFSGVTADVLINNNLSFTVSGPDDFETMTIEFKDFKIDEDRGIATYVLENVPTGLYTVSENNAEVENFELHISGDYGEENGKTVNKNEQVKFKITNEYEVNKTTYRVVKVWQDEHNKDGSRPTKLAINLLANGETSQTKDLSAENETEEDWGEDLETSDVWEWTFENLPVADENAEEIEYYAEEPLEIEGYEQIDEISGRRTTIFVNMHEPEEDEGYGGLPMTPETGKLTKLIKTDSENSASVNMAISVAMMIGISLVGMAFIFTKREQ